MYGLAVQQKHCYKVAETEHESEIPGLKFLAATTQQVSGSQQAAHGL